MGVLGTVGAAEVVGVGLCRSTAHEVVKMSNNSPKATAAFFIKTPL